MSRFPWRCEICGGYPTFGHVDITASASYRMFIASLQWLMTWFVSWSQYENWVDMQQPSTICIHQWGWWSHRSLCAARVDARSVHLRPTVVQIAVPIHCNSRSNLKMMKYMCIWIYTIIYIPTYLPIYLSIYLPTYLHTYIHTYTHTHMNIYIYIHTWIYIYTHVYVSMYVIYIYTYAIQRRKEALTHVCQISLDSHVGSAGGDFSSPWVSVAMGFSTDFVHIKKQHIHGKITGYGCLDKWIYQYFPYLGCGFIIGHIWTHLDSRSDQKKNTGMMREKLFPNCCAGYHHSFLGLQQPLMAES